MGEWEGGRVGGGWSHSAWMEEGEVDWLGDPVERLARAAGRPTTGFKNQVVCVCVCVCVCVSVCWMVVRHEFFHRYSYKSIKERKFNWDWPRVEGFFQ